MGRSCRRLPWPSAKSELGTKRSVLTPNQLFLPLPLRSFHLPSSRIRSPLRSLVMSQQEQQPEKTEERASLSPSSRVRSSSAAVTARKLTISSSSLVLLRDPSREERRGTSRRYPPLDRSRLTPQLQQIEAQCRVRPVAAPDDLSFRPTLFGSARANLLLRPIPRAGRV